MFKLLNIILPFLLFSVSFPGNAQDNFKVFIPEFILNGGDFEVSIITSKEFPGADKLDLYLIPDVTLTINKVELWTNSGKSEIAFHPEFLDEFSAASQKVHVDLTDTTLFNSESFFQLVIQLKSDPTNSNALKIYGEFIGEEKILGHLRNLDDKLISHQPDLYNLSFHYYEKYSTAEYAAFFSQNSYLNIPLVYNFEEVLAAEFWMKLKDFNSTFLKIIDWETNRIDYYLSVNENQMLMVTSKNNDLLQLKPFFISQNIWSHFNLTFDKRTSALSFFCNGEEFAKIKINNYFTYDNLVLHFQNDRSIGAFYLDQFRLVNINGSSSGLDRNRNYSDYSDDSSSVIFQMNFSEAELSSLLNQKIVSYENIKLTDSDSPIFPRAPGISLNIMNNFYEIEWTGGDLKNTAYYVLERAIGNGDFFEAGREVADNFENKVYSILSEKYNRPEIVYFRIKQVNKDGTKVYSDVMKVGQGIIEDIIIGQNYPNPFNPTTQIEFELIQDSDVEVKVFNLAGKEVALLHKGFLPQGIYHFKFDASGLPSGIYLYQVRTPSNTQTRKMVLAK